jgi:hypothetical protein
MTICSPRQRSASGKCGFSGAIYAHQLRMSIGVCVRDLELVAKVGEPVDMIGQTLFLPL